MSSNQLLLMPFSWLYGIGAWWHRKEYDWGFRKRVSFDIPVLCIGNLSAGGTGKTPHTAYLIQLLKIHFKVGVLSRGYKRKTKGYFLVNEDSEVHEAGDEVLLLKKKFPDVVVAVCEDRVIGIASLISDHEELQVILLDDAFQHLAVQPLASIILMDWNRPYFNDHLLPAGRLREPLSILQRADALIVTKSPDEVKASDVIELKQKLHWQKDRIFFMSKLVYDIPYSLFNKDEKLFFEKNLSALAISGIADPQSMMQFLENKFELVKQLIFSDHHAYTTGDAEKIISAFDSIASDQKIIITTEKDAVRLARFREKFQSRKIRIFALPIHVRFLPEYERSFHEYIFSLIQPDHDA